MAIMNETAMDNNTYNADKISSITIVFSAIDAFLGIVIIIGNVLTIVAVCKFRRLQNPSNVMIVFLSLSDLIVGLYTPTKIVFEAWPYLMTRKFTCMLKIFSSHFSAFCALLGLTMLSLERAYAIQFPFHYQSSMTVRRAAYACGIAFSFLFLLLLPMLTGLGNWDIKFCVFSFIYPGSYTKTLFALAVCLLLVGFLAFLRVLAAEWKRRKQVFSVGQQDNRREVFSRRSKLMCIIYASSLVFWTPLLAYYLYNTITNHSRNVAIFKMVSVLYFCSSLANFFIYGFKNSNFRLAYKQLLGLQSTSDPSINNQPELT